MDIRVLTSVQQRVQNRGRNGDHTSEYAEFAPNDLLVSVASRHPGGPASVEIPVERDGRRDVGRVGDWKLTERFVVDT